MNAIRTVYRCKLQTLTPLHVGSGESLACNFDFFAEGKRLVIINRERMFAKLRELGEQKIMEFTAAIEAENPADWLEKNEIRLSDIASLSIRMKDKELPKEIRCQLRDAFNNMLVPGSSLKGALRTAIIRRLSLQERTDITRNIQSGRPQFADQRIVKSLLGKNPNSNLMRTLAVGDISFSETAPDLLQVWVNRLVNKKDFKGKFPLAIEAIPPGAKAYGMVTFDEYLPDKDAEEKCFNFKQRLTLTWLLAACRELTLHTIRSELEFLQGASGKIKGLVSFYNDLRQQVENLNGNEAIIQLGWGIGWRGMTGQLLETGDLTRERRQELRLAPQKKYLDFPFPKSRRLATVDGRALPMGWVKLSFVSKVEVKREEEALRLRQQEKKRQQELAEKEAEEKARREAELAAMSEEERLVRLVEDAPADQSGEQLVNSQCYPKLSTLDGEDRKRLAAALKTFYEKLGKWKVKKKNKKQFEKVQAIKAVLGEQ